jgi:hypothetical protein
MLPLAEFAHLCQSLGLSERGGERFLFEHMHMVLGCRLDNSGSDVVRNGDDHEVQLFGLEHLAEVSVGGDAESLLLAQHVRVVVADGDQVGGVAGSDTRYVVLERLLAQPHNSHAQPGPRATSGRRKSPGVCRVLCLDMRCFTK